MSNKNHGEGDYDASRRFNQSERDFVARKGVPRTHVNASEEQELKNAEARGKDRAKGIDHDAVDATLLRDEIKQRK